MGATLISCQLLHGWCGHDRTPFSKPLALIEPVTIKRSFCTNYADELNENYSFLDFPDEDLNWGYCDYWESFSDKGPIRHGDITDGLKQGRWIWGEFESDTTRHQIRNTYIKREEYFKDGLRDSIFTVYNESEEIIYTTVFHMGTGLLKDFYDNGELYFEINTMDGYFTDTLRLYTEQGALKEKLLFIKDSLVYHQIFVKD
jgi:hypothetical protein